MKSQNGNKVMSNKTQITVFTHGWTGDAGSWGSGEDSLVTKLGKLINANIYTYLFHHIRSLNLYYNYLHHQP